MSEVDNALGDLGEHIAANLGNEVDGFAVLHGELNIQTRAEAIERVLSFLRDDANCKFTQLIDLCGVDYPERARRFDVVYHLLSPQLNQRIRVKLETDAETPVPSVTGIFSTASWFEREAWDMYGVLFSGHPDLRRILTDYGFQGFPLRKDFPLTGYVEMRYSEEEKRVIYEPVKLPQEFRAFDFMSPWEGAEYILPGDEKATAAEKAAEKK